MRHLQFLVGFLVALAMLVLLFLEDNDIARWIEAGVGAAAIFLMLITYLMPKKKKGKAAEAPKDKVDARNTPAAKD